MKYWLVKTEASSYSIDDLEKDTKKNGFTAWTGVRNFQARNYLKEMKPGDLVLFYHSSGTKDSPTGVYGIAKVVNEAHSDPTAKDAKEKSLWVSPDLAFLEKFSDPVTLEAIKSNNKLEGILVAKRGIRLSVMPVSKEHFEEIHKGGK